jgi:two-component system chemotaxis sensor kinase CheA
MGLEQNILNKQMAESAELVERFAGVCLNLRSEIELSSGVLPATMENLRTTVRELKDISERSDRLRLASAFSLIEDGLAELHDGRALTDASAATLLAQAQLVLEKLFSASTSFDESFLLTELESLCGQFMLCCIYSSARNVPSAGVEHEAEAKAEAEAEAEAKAEAEAEAETAIVRPECLRSDEVQLISKFKTRDEAFFLYSGCGDSSRVLTRILPVGDVLIYREHAEDFLFIFATELEQPLVEAIVEGSVRLLQKSAQDIESVVAAWVLSLPVVQELPVIEPQAELSVEAVSAVTPAEVQVQEGVEIDAPVPETFEVDVPVEEKLSRDSSLQLPLPATLPPAAASESSEYQENVSETYQLSETSQSELVADFLSNAHRLLETLNRALLTLERNPAETSVVDEVFRAAHTIKGTAGMLGFSGVEKLLHALEGAFDKIRLGQLKPTADVVDLLLVGSDKVRDLFILIEFGKTPEIEVDDYLSKLEELGCNIAPDDVPAELNKYDGPDNFSQSSGHSNETQGSIRVDLKRLESLVSLVSELVTDRTRFADIGEELRKSPMHSDLGHRMSESVSIFGRHMNEIQNLIMQVRMVPAGELFLKFSRMVRDLARQTGKEVELQVEGAEVELDKTLVEELADTLIHLLRNAVDHGIELPEIRESLGKPRTGKIQLKVSRQGNLVVICVTDDGQGLNTEKIRLKAIEKGLAGANETLSRSDLFELIFRQGFSTAEKVTNISGRGVGMDVVKMDIQRLKGVISLDSQEGRGTAVSVKLPLTLAIVPSLVVEVHGEGFAIPLVNVIESLRIDPSEIQQMGSSRFFKVREQVIPVVNLAEALEIPSGHKETGYRRPAVSSTLQTRRRERVVFVVLGIGPERFGLIVDRIISQQDIVIRSLGRLLRNDLALAGGCVMGDGRVALVLDVAHIFGNENNQRGKHARRAS